MGIVWSARDERLERVVAIKQLVLQPGLSEQETDEARRRAMREARIAARLQHPNAVSVFDVAQHQGEPCLVMEFMPSRSLSSVLAERGTLPPEEAADICAQVASALAVAHAAGIVHRDIKPGNILLGETGTAKITDFGISRAVGDVTVTQTGISAGTPAYLAPEVARGQDPSPSADVFSLGATLYNAVEGRPPFGTSQNPLALLHAVATGEVPPPKQAGPLTELLMALVHADPTQRPSMSAAAEALTLASDGKKPSWTPAPPTAVLAEPPTATGLLDSPANVEPAAPPRDRRPLLIGVGVLVVVLLVGTIVAFALINPPNTPTPGPTTSGTSQPAPNTAPNNPAATTTTTQAQPPTSSAPTSTTTTPPTSTTTTPPTSVTNDQSGGPIDFATAGQFVIDYYSQGVAGFWSKLSGNVQQQFGSEQAFRDYWGQFSQVYSNNAQGVTANPDGSVNVPVDVTYFDKGNPPKQNGQHKTINVIRSGGQLLINSDGR
ncbi:serine/threonine-protein kinase [Kutzneria viridogrisea]|uniref:non-specific serine/threonine protein kinase n=2 Tax=Kutzneria TaxID=43356 RepID=W5W8L8_9PSEU|nr:serine/threonine-protein kinase [Kutzneria albida]AHH96881.1 putative serine/threonine protein kinase [Kutzneria albida DSM 43870]MBA8927896.1 serine/threonine protein kinase [Kutzneria viridogrisea]